MRLSQKALISADHSQEILRPEKYQHRGYASGERNCNLSDGAYEKLIVTYPSAAEAERALCLIY